jgi:hypothetical protein
MAYAEANFFTLPRKIRDNWEEWIDGIVELPEVGQVSESYLKALAAEELGHACTRLVDIERRHAPYDEWGSEAAADWYAYRWGFRSLMASSYPASRSAGPR